MFGKTLVAGAAGLLLAVPALPAFAQDSVDGSETKGACSAGAFWELKAEAEDSGTLVEFQVKSAAGESWDYSVSDSAGVIAQGTKTTGSRDKFTVKAYSDDAADAVYTATATSTGGQVCDTTVGALVDGNDDANDDSTDSASDQADSQDDSGDDDVYDGSCSADSALAMTVTKAGKNRVAKLSLKGSRAGEKWRYTIHRGNKVVQRGVARTKGKNARLKVTKKTRGKGMLRAEAVRVGGHEDCSVDDDVTNDDTNDDTGSDSNDD